MSGTTKLKGGQLTRLPSLRPHDGPFTFQACVLCDVSKPLLSSSHAYNTAKVKYMCVTDALRADVALKAQEAGFSISEYFRSQDAHELAATLGVRPNSSGLNSFGLQPTFMDTERSVNY